MISLLFLVLTTLSTVIFFVVDGYSSLGRLVQSTFGDGDDGSRFAAGVNRKGGAGSPTVTHPPITLTNLSILCMKLVRMFVSFVLLA